MLIRFAIWIVFDKKKKKIGYQDFGVIVLTVTERPKVL